MKRSTRLTLIFSMIFTCTLQIGVLDANSAVYYVSTAGNDNNAGTVAAPFRTINRGKQVLKPGDTLYLHGGVYAEQLTSGIPSGTSSAYITFAAYPGETPILRPSYVSGLDPRVLYLFNVSYLVFDGLTFDGINKRQTPPLPPAYGTGAGVIKFDANADGSGQPHHIIMKNFEVLNGRESGILGWGNEITFSHCKVHDNGMVDSYRSGRQGFYWNGNHTTIEFCDIYNNNGSGVIFWDAHTDDQMPGGNSCCNILRNSIIRDHHMQTLNSNPDFSPGVMCATNLSAGTSCDIYNNIIYNNDVGVYLTYNCCFSGGIYNNTIYNNRHGQVGGTGQGIWFAIYGRGMVVKNNIIYKNEGPPVQIDNQSGGTIVSNNLTSGDPLFVNALAGNFHLMAGSPAIGAGTNLSSMFLSDFELNPRPSCCYDVGAYQYIRAAPQAPSNLAVK